MSARQRKLWKRWRYFRPQAAKCLECKRD